MTRQRRKPAAWWRVARPIGRARGDNRTPDKTIGQVKYADNEGGSEQKTPRGSRTSLGPEKQGGP